jgi:hypothetical protein
MPIKRCKYCKTRMTKVIYGMPRENDYLLENGFTDFAGCIIEQNAEDWYCSKCDAKVIKSITPKSGVCLLELPSSLQVALQMFLGRFSLVMQRDEDQHFEDELSLSCPHVDDEIDEDLLSAHDLRGDFMVIRLCASHTLEFYLDGTAVSKLAYIDDSQPPYIEELSRWTELDCDAFVDLKDKEEDLPLGNAAFSSVGWAMFDSRNMCSGYLCDHEEGDPWALVFEHLKNQILDELEEEAPLN